MGRPSFTGSPFARKTFLAHDASPGPRMSLLLEGGFVVTQDKERRVIPGEVLVEGGRIVSVGVAAAAVRGFLSWATLDEALTTQRGDPVKNAEAFVAKHKGDPLVTPSVGVQGVYAASEETYVRARDVAVRHGVRLHTHLAETRGEGGPPAPPQGAPLGRSGGPRAGRPRLRDDSCSGGARRRGPTRFNRGREACGPRGRVAPRPAHDSFLSGEPHQPSRLQLSRERCRGDDRRRARPHVGWARPVRGRGGRGRAGAGDRPRALRGMIRDLRGRCGWGGGP